MYGTLGRRFFSRKGEFVSLYTECIFHDPDQLLFQCRRNSGSDFIWDASILSAAGFIRRRPPPLEFFVPHTACNSAECLLFDTDCNGFDRRERRKQRYNAFVSFDSFYQTFCGFVSPVWHWSDHTGCDSFACRNYMETKRRADSCMGVDFHFDDTFIFVSPQWWIIHPG